MAKIIVHLDLNAFFASAEEIRNPKLKNKPLVVGGSGRKGIVSTASYEARKYGIHSAMPIFQARKLCPSLIILPVDFKYYRLLSQEFFNFVKQYSKIVEIASVDECFVDMSETLKDVENKIEFLKKI
ncbi:MAG: DNA polymerase IV, partial [Bacilli bacterium]|nr:DNA polymerase IV [Bacilli bacterium]